MLIFYQSTKWRWSRFFYVRQFPIVSKSPFVSCILLPFVCHLRTHADWIFAHGSNHPVWKNMKKFSAIWPLAPISAVLVQARNANKTFLQRGVLEKIDFQNFAESNITRGIWYRLQFHWQFILSLFVFCRNRALLPHTQQNCGSKLSWVFARHKKKEMKAGKPCFKAKHKLFFFLYCDGSAYQLSQWVCVLSPVWRHFRERSGD